jgi:hypothetical protein
LTTSSTSLYTPSTHFIHFLIPRRKVWFTRATTRAGCESSIVAEDPTGGAFSEIAIFDGASGCFLDLLLLEFCVVRPYSSPRRRHRRRHRLWVCVVDVPLL